MAKQYDVIIVGGGPAGIFAALELSKSSDLNILLIEKGKDIDKRSNLVSGLGGAGAFSDGKLTLSSQVGGRLNDYLKQLALPIDDYALKIIDLHLNALKIVLSKNLMACDNEDSLVLLSGLERLLKV